MKKRRTSLASKYACGSFGYPIATIQNGFELSKKTKGMKTGLLLFALFSVFSIVLPRLLSVTPIPEEWNFVAIYRVISMLTLGFGMALGGLSKILK